MPPVETSESLTLHHAWLFVYFRNESLVLHSANVPLSYQSVRHSRHGWHYNVIAHLVDAMATRGVRRPANHKLVRCVGCRMIDANCKPARRHVCVRQCPTRVRRVVWRHSIRGRPTRYQTKRFTGCPTGCSTQNPTKALIKKGLSE